MPMATTPKISCKMLKPRNGIWTSNSIASDELASKTTGGAHNERRKQASLPSRRGQQR